MRERERERERERFKKKKRSIQTLRKTKERKGLFTFKKN